MRSHRAALIASGLFALCLLGDARAADHTDGLIELDVTQALGRVQAPRLVVRQRLLQEPPIGWVLGQTRASPRRQLRFARIERRECAPRPLPVQRGCPDSRRWYPAQNSVPCRAG